MVAGSGKVVQAFSSPLFFLLSAFLVFFLNMLFNSKEVSMERRESEPSRDWVRRASLLTCQRSGLADPHSWELRLASPLLRAGAGGASSLAASLTAIGEVRTTGAQSQVCCWIPAGIGCSHAGPWRLSLHGCLRSPLRARICYPEMSEDVG